MNGLGSGLGPLRNGNPRGNPNLAPRCGARTRSGCPCRGPAMANARCRMHGGRSTGPRTAAGLARMRASKLRHGLYAEELTAELRYARVLRRRAMVLDAAMNHLPELPAFLAVRLTCTGAPELLPPPAPRPDDGTSPCAVSGRARRCAVREAARVEAARLAPWRQAIDAARARRRVARDQRRARMADRGTSPCAVRRVVGRALPARLSPLMALALRGTALAHTWARDRGGRLVVLEQFLAQAHAT
jgi:hypothetical protein